MSWAHVDVSKHANNGWEYFFSENNRKAILKTETKDLYTFFVYKFRWGCVWMKKHFICVLLNLPCRKFINYKFDELQKIHKKFDSAVFVSTKAENLSFSSLPQILSIFVCAFGVYNKLPWYFMIFGGQKQSYLLIFFTVQVYISLTLYLSLILLRLKDRRRKIRQ